MIRSRETGRSVPLPDIAAWTVGDEVGMEVAIQMLEKLLSKGRNSRNYLHFNMVRQLQATALDIYSATADYRYSHYYLKSHLGIFLHMYEGGMQSSLMERFSKGAKKKLPEDSDQDRIISSTVRPSSSNGSNNRQLQQFVVINIYFLNFMSITYQRTLVCVVHFPSTI